MHVTFIGVQGRTREFDHAPTWDELAQVELWPLADVTVYNSTLQRPYLPEDPLPDDLPIRLDALPRSEPRTIHLDTPYWDHLDALLERQEEPDGPFTLAELCAEVEVHPFWIQELWLWQRQVMPRRRQRLIVLDFEYT